MSKPAIREAEDEYAEVRLWYCETCDAMIEDRVAGPYCKSCAAYWEDVRNGLFDD